MEGEKSAYRQDSIVVCAFIGPYQLYHMAPLLGRKTRWLLDRLLSYRRTEQRWNPLACQRQYGMIFAEGTNTIPKLNHYLFLCQKHWNQARLSVRQGAFMTITSGECLFVILLVAAFVGIWRGWIREVITTAILLGAILFLSLGGQDWLYRFFFVNLVDAVKALFEGSSVTVPAGSSSPLQPQSDFWFTFLTFGGLTSIAYVVGHKAHTPSPQQLTPRHRLVGVVPGLVNGITILFYSVRNNILSPTGVNVQSPNQTNINNSLPIIFGLGLVVVVGALIWLTTKGKAKK